MSAKSSFEFKFSEKDMEEGKKICVAIGQDMTTVEGYISHEVIQDYKDPGHFIVGTVYDTQEHGTSVLSRYQHDPKLARAKALMGKESPGFLGDIIS